MKLYLTRTCKGCGNLLNNEQRSYCSEKCEYNYKKSRYNENRIKLSKRQCKRCGKTFQPKFKRHVFCSLECRKRIRNNFNKYDLREFILERDNFTCQKCKRRFHLSSELHAHHIIPLHKGGKDILQNITTLCKQCHQEIHSLAYSKDYFLQTERHLKACLEILPSICDYIDGCVLRKGWKQYTRKKEIEKLIRDIIVLVATYDRFGAKI